MSQLEFVPRPWLWSGVVAMDRREVEAQLVERQVLVHHSEERFVVHHSKQKANLIERPFALLKYDSLESWAQVGCLE